VAALGHSLTPALTEIGRRVMANSSPSSPPSHLFPIPLAEILQVLLLRPPSHPIERVIPLGMNLTTTVYIPY